MKTVEAAVIGVGWVGGTRAETLSRTALVDKLHLCEIRPDRLAEVKTLYKPATATLDYNDIINNENISVVYISTTPEIEPLSDLPRLPEIRQERDAGKADRAGIVGGRRADPARQAQRSQIHHRLFAALQPEDRLRQEEDRRRHARQRRVGAGQPAPVAQPGQEDRQPRAALARRHGIDARPRLRVLAAWSRPSPCASIRRAPTAT